MQQVTPKYKYLEAKAILKNPEQWSLIKIEKAKEIVKNYTIEEPTPITDKQRAEIKRKYPKTYEGLSEQF